MGDWIEYSYYDYDPWGDYLEMRRNRIHGVKYYLSFLSQIGYFQLLLLYFIIMEIWRFKLKNHSTIFSN